MKRVDAIIYGIELVIGSIAMACIAALVFATVIARYVLNKGILWADEVVVNLFVLLVMMGGALCFRFRKHTEMTLVMNILPKVGCLMLRAVIQIVVFVFLVVFIYSGIILMKNSAGLTTSILRIPMTYIYGVLPFGGILMLYEFGKDTVKRLTEDRAALKKTV